MRVSSVGCESADIGGSSIPFQITVTYLGVHLDQTPSVKQQFTSLCRTTFLALRRIESIRPFLSNSSTEKLVASMITSAMLLSQVYPMNKSHAYKRSRTTPRGLSLKTKSKRDHVTPLLKEHRWLPVKYRIQDKFATLAFRHFDGTLPPYLSLSLPSSYQKPSGSLRYSTERLLNIPKTNLENFGGRYSLVTLL